MHFYYTKKKKSFLNKKMSKLVEVLFSRFLNKLNASDGFQTLLCEADSFLSSNIVHHYKFVDKFMNRYKNVPESVHLLVFLIIEMFKLLLTQWTKQLEKKNRQKNIKRFSLLQ